VFPFPLPLPAAVPFPLELVPLAMLADCVVCGATLDLEVEMADTIIVVDPINGVELRPVIVLRVVASDAKAADARDSDAADAADAADLTEAMEAAVCDA